ncbi:CDCA3 protein, partial [Leiothrix lutea]|nr:CDCA3 protein [Leiothrix lutea]
MGASGSAPATPAAPRNKHLAHVTDPRSPTAGILRTPIEVVSSPAGSPQPSPAEPPAATGQERDPRSPTPGISRTPMRAVSIDSVDRLVKQLSEAFGALAPEPAPPGAASPAEEPARRSSPPAGEEAERPPSPSTARPGRAAGHGFSSDLAPDRACPYPLVRLCPPTWSLCSQFLLGTLLLSNRFLSRVENLFPTCIQNQEGKRHVLGENLGEKKEVDLSRSLKSGNCAWSDLNKENQQCPFVEN